MNKVWEIVIDIFVGILIMFVSVTVYFGLKTETVMKSMYENITDDFITEVKKNGVITLSDYEGFMERIGIGHNIFDIDFEHRHTILEPEYRFKTLEEIQNELKYKGPNEYHYREVITERPHVEDPINNGNLNTETNESILAKAKDGSPDPNHIHTDECYAGYRHEEDTNLICNTYIVSLTPTHPNQTVYLNDPLITTAIAKFKDGSTKTVLCTTEFTTTTIGKNQNAILKYRNEAKTAGKIVLGISYSGVLYASSDGVTWKSVLSDVITDVTFGNGKFVALGRNKSYVSEDGIKWTGKQTIINGDLFDLSFITFVDGHFYATATYYGAGYSENIIVRSTDGLNWINEGHAGISYHSGIAYSKDIKKLLWSTSQTNENGNTYFGWTIQEDGSLVRYTNIGGTSLKLLQVGDRAALICEYGTYISDHGHIMGYLWGYIPQVMQYGNGKYMAISREGVFISESLDQGFRSVLNKGFDVCYDLIYFGDKFMVSATDNGENIVAFSTDGKNWSRVKTPVLFKGLACNAINGSGNLVSYAGSSIIQDLTCNVTVTVIPRNKTCSKGHTYNLNHDGTDPGCPYCRAWVESIRVIYPETVPIVITIGTSFQDNGVKLLATYMDGHTEVVTSGYVDNLDNKYLGTKPVTIGYKGATVTVLVTTKCATIICDICGYEYELWPDGTNPGCPRCRQKIPVFTGNIMEYDHINHTEEILESLYQKGKYVFNDNDIFKISINNRSSNISRAILKKIYPSLSERWLILEKSEYIKAK